ncbi:MAG: Omp28-related outer membrane protein [Flavobacteriales bacterium]|nr:Omp28-related outer membrane protein [Flavobacteriales bacterium]
MRLLTTISLAATVCFSGCDVIDNPVIDLGIGYRGEALVPEFSLLTGGPRHVLIEDFTAHECGNCPPAAVVAEALAEGGGGLVHAIAVHAGPLAAVQDAPFDTDWTCEEAELWWSQLGIQVNPIGRVNRRGGSGASLPPTVWEAEMEAALIEPANLHLQGLAVEDGDDVHVHVHGSFSAAVEGEVRLAVVVLESGLVGAQLNYASDPEVLTDYEFNHMLRGSVSGGDGLPWIADASAGDVLQSDYSMVWNPDWSIENCHLLAIATASDGEVLAVLELPWAE